jgi:hypothetical protein
MVTAASGGYWIAMGGDEVLPTGDDHRIDRCYAGAELRRHDGKTQSIQPPMEPPDRRCH